MADVDEPVPHKVTFTFENLESGQILETVFLRATKLDFDLQAETGELEFLEPDGANPGVSIHVKALNLTFKLRGEPGEGGEFYTTRVVHPGGGKFVLRLEAEAFEAKVVHGLNSPGVVVNVYLPDGEPAPWASHRVLDVNTVDVGFGRTMPVGTTVVVRGA